MKVREIHVYNILKSRLLWFLCSAAYLNYIWTCDLTDYSLSQAA